MSVVVAAAAAVAAVAAVAAAVVSVVVASHPQAIGRAKPQARLCQDRNHCDVIGMSPIMVMSLGWILLLFVC